MTDRLLHGEGKGPAPAKAAARGGLMLAGCWLFLGGLGWLDYITGYEVPFFVLCSAPVGVAAKCAGIGVALGTTMTWLLANHFSGAKYSTPFFHRWNSAILFLAFCPASGELRDSRADSGHAELYTVIPRRTRQHPTHHLGPTP